MKFILKEILFAIFAVLALPFTLAYFLISLVINKNQCIAFFSQLLSLIPGKLGAYFRAGFYRFTLRDCSKDAVISFATLLSQQDVSIASGVYIGPQCNIGMCNIRQNVLLGSGVHIMSGAKQHNFDDVNIPIRDQGGLFTKVEIGKNSWVGNAALIMADIGENCVVAAGSVVISAVPDNAIVGGNPAKIIKLRS
ncbi:MAG: virginiamycin A acetyltransferase [Glaciecola sp.]|jgi:acetyltransferase-like isoleucine patch superfamily enzyme